MEFLMVGAGGFAGAALRHAMGMIPLFSFFNFPVATLVINFLGAFLIGLVTMAAIHFDPHRYIILFLKTGLCGGFTTFSTFSLETIDLINAGRPVAGILYAVLSVVICVLAIYLSRLLFQAVFL